MKIINSALVAYTNERWEHACPTIRIICPIEQAGLQLIKGSDWEEGTMHVFPERVSKTNAILIQRDFPRNVAEYEEVMNRARSEGKYVVYELDDLLPEIPKQHPDYYHYQSCRTGIIRAILEADAVVGSTRGICDYMRQFNPNVWELPNYLDDRFWDLNTTTKTENDPLIIGYMGGHTHSYDLEIVAPLLIRILDKYKNQIKVKFWGLGLPDPLWNWPNVEWDNINLINYRKFAIYFQKQKCDIFLAPLQDNPFNQSKSHLKFLEYSALAVPGVYSRIAPYEGVVFHGKNGFLASRPEEWEDYVYQLIENPPLRSKIGSEAQSYVRTHWMLSHHIERWREFYEEITSRKGRSKQSFLIANATRKIQSFHAEMDARLYEIREELYQAHTQLEVLQNQLIEKDRASLELRRFAEQYYYLYHDILNTNSWKALEILARIRFKLAPKGSKRDRLMTLFFKSPRVLRKEGTRAFLQTIKNQTIELFNNHGSQTAIGSIRLKPVLLDVPFFSRVGDFLPVISILVINDPELPYIDAMKVHNWVSHQTYGALADIILWDRISHSARVLDQNRETWRIDNLKNLCEIIKTKYICIASEHLLLQEATYLETNLIALESQSLAFTVNLYGNAEWAKRLLGRGYLPGGESLPLLRQVVLRECVRDDLSLDLSPWIEKWQRPTEEVKQTDGPDFPVVAGRIITHTTAYDDKKEMLPFLSKIHGQECILQGKDLLINPRNKQIWESCARIYTPINKIIPANPEISDLPTVIVVMPFLAVGGAERVTLDIMQQLKEQLRFAIVTFEEHDSALGTTADAFRQITPFVYSLPDFALETQYASFMTYLIERIKPSTIYIANGTYWIYDALGGIKESYPNLRIVDQVYDAQVGWINRYDFPVILYTDGHIGVNAKICQAYIQKGVKPEQVYLIENGVNPDNFNPAEYPVDKRLQIKEKLGLDPDKKLISFASRLHPQKRPMDFIELARRFSSDISVEFLMVGNGPLSSQVNEQIHKLEVKNIHRCEFYHPINDVLAISDVLVLPSEFEGMPMIVIEAQAMGKPVVVTDVGNNREIIERTGGGVVVSRIGDVSAMMQAINEMMNTPPDPDQLRRLTLSYFDLKLIAQKYLNALLGNHSNDEMTMLHDGGL